MVTTNITHVAHLVEICFQRGIRHVVLSPGSRNAPLIIAFDEHPGIKTWLIHDERCAAFFAIGISDATRQPVAIACTSGSAPLNYAPAIAEAYYRNVPLLILTADRPVHLIDQGDGQTIRQKNVFQNIVKASFELPDFSISNELEKSDLLVNDAMSALLQDTTAPVHINIPLSEPLYNTAELISAPKINLPEFSSVDLNAVEKNQIAEIWKNSDKKLILIGQHSPDLHLMNALLPVLNDSSIAVLVENTSNIQNFEKIVHCIDRTLAVIGEDELEQFQPDLLVTLGGAIISKKIKAFLRNCKPKHNWRVGKFLFDEDTFQSLTKTIGLEPHDFFEFAGNIEYTPNSNFGNRWKQKDFFAQDKHTAFLTQTAWCDLKVFEIVLDMIPVNSNLHLANSSVVRYAQLFNPDKTISYFANRGVSGIDGSTSTAAGFSVVSPKLNVLITGDISFLYDSNALWNKYLKSNFKIILINNGGGGIFQILDGSNSVKQANYFFSPYEAEIAKICDAFSISYTQASDQSTLESQLATFFYEPFDGPVLIEVKTFSQNNAAVLKEYFNALRLA